MEPQATSTSKAIKKSKEIIYTIIGFLILILIIGIFIYDKFFYQPPPYIPMSAQEQRQLEDTLIKRYGSLEAAEEDYRQREEDFYQDSDYQYNPMGR